jgi:hypothetical protein
LDTNHDCPDIGLGPAKVSSIAFFSGDISLPLSLAIVIVLLRGFTGPLIKGKLGKLVLGAGNVGLPGRPGGVELTRLLVEGDMATAVGAVGECAGVGAFG